MDRRGAGAPAATSPQAQRTAFLEGRRTAKFSYAWPLELAGLMLSSLAVHGSNRKRAEVFG
eukprot:11699994-Alexandrium_andersonii.AAC.1